MPTKSRKKAAPVVVEEPEVEVEELDEAMVIDVDEPEGLEDAVTEVSDEAEDDGDDSGEVTAKMLANELGTDARTFRKFLRTVEPKDRQPGQGGRWSFDAETAAEYRAKWIAAQNGAKAKKASAPAGKKARKAAKVAVAEELADVDLDLDADFQDLLDEDLEPSAEELAAIDDVEDEDADVPDTGEDDDIEEI